VPGSTSSSLNLVLADNPVNNPTLIYVSGTDSWIKYGTATPINLNDHLVKVSDLTFANVSMANTKDLIRIFFTISYNSATSSLTEFNYSKNFYGSISRKK
jgi:hypothetical protein